MASSLWTSVSYLLLGQNANKSNSWQFEVQSNMELATHRLSSEEAEVNTGAPLANSFLRGTQAHGMMGSYVNLLTEV